MKKVFLFSLLLFIGLIFAQIIPSLLGENYESLHTILNTLLFVCLGFIMINVGREFSIDKGRWKSYGVDYLVAMGAAGLPWLFITLYYVFVLMPSDLWGNWTVWQENLLLSRFAAPTSAGILFTMLAAAGLTKTWVYHKIQVLAIFDDLDTILLMIPLQMLMIGLKWELLGILIIVSVLLIIGWRKMGEYNIKQNWYMILIYAIFVIVFTQGIYYLSSMFWGKDGAIHIEVLLPAFVFGMIMRHKHLETKNEIRAKDFISYLFMFLVGINMPQFIGGDMFSATSESAQTYTSAQPMLSAGEIAFHVVMVTILSNLGKLFPMFFYRYRSLKERLAMSIGMFTRGEVGAGIIFISLGYGLGGSALVISVLVIVLNLMLTGFFIAWVMKLLKSMDNE